MQPRVVSRPFVGPPEPQKLSQRLATRLYDATRQRRLVGANQRTTAEGTRDGTESVTVVCISDTHNSFPSPLPPGDILLHAGDLSRFGTFAEIQAQISWLAAQPHSHKVIIAGNHDLLLDPAFVATHPDRELDRWPGRLRSDLEWGDVQYLERTSLDLVIKGKDRLIRVFGSPWTPRCGSWAFQYSAKNDKDSLSPTGKVPAGTDVMLVHGPPKGYLDDTGKGCAALLAEVWRVKPKLVVCGHIHAGRGEERLHFNPVDSWYKNIMIGERQWLSIMCLALYHFWLIATGWFALTLTWDEGKYTRLVNAAVAGERGESDLREPIVVVI
ncbi:hypothetical protein QQS21_007444 [Conoideocrella luteorostrata]|uniref:Calcineurin-like phosphoesterase domain-containing protein n=1 Tax=Conoideocrella luteorostrata TaxID=1105319 RepID=A0AAJ0CQ05_9HYPO|nr:hypothetical protein QQS21_007444 [Conoideocrella luteorostrata]